MKPSTIQIRIHTPRCQHNRAVNECFSERLWKAQISNHHSSPTPSGPGQIKGKLPIHNHTGDFKDKDQCLIPWFLAQILPFRVISYLTIPSSVSYLFTERQELTTAHDIFILMKFKKAVISYTYTQLILYLLVINIEHSEVQNTLYPQHNFTSIWRV